VKLSTNDRAKGVGSTNTRELLVERKVEHARAADLGLQQRHAWMLLYDSADDR
jgi:hypothetical protein